MHIVGLKYYSASDARKAKALVAGASVNFRHQYESSEHPDAYRAVCRRFHIGHMPSFASRLLVAAGGPSPVAGTVTSVSGRGGSTQVIVELTSPLKAAPENCSLRNPAPKGFGVYAIVNVRNMKAYIGSTNDFETRRVQHLRALEQGTHFSPNLQLDWRADPAAFAFVVIDEAPADLLQKEGYRKYIHHTEDPAVGYNQGCGFSPAHQWRSPSASSASAPRHTQVSTLNPNSPWDAHGRSGVSSGTGVAGHGANGGPTGNTTKPVAPQPAGCMIMLAIMAATVGLAIGMAAARAGL